MRLNIDLVLHTEDEVTDVDEEMIGEEVVNALKYSTLDQLLVTVITDVTLNNITIGDSNE